MSDLRGVARQCMVAALAAVDPRALVRSALASSDARSGLGSNIRMIAVGKAAVGMAKAAVEALPEQIRGGVVVVPHGFKMDGFDQHIEMRTAGHPLPDESSVEAARRVMAILEGSSESDTILLLLSGGASALMTLPVSGLTLQDIEMTTQRLLNSGASIDRINAVRKRLDRLKGGRLAKVSSAGRIAALVLSDVPGDRLDVIASGPVTPDSASSRGAGDWLRGQDLWSRLPGSVRRHLAEIEPQATPLAGDPCFDRVETRLIGSNELAVKAALAAAELQGFRARRVERRLSGEARIAGRRLAREVLELRAARGAGERLCLVVGGETSVTVTGAGSGGRNQEVALGAALELVGAESILIAAFGTDGRDGTTEAAGAWVDGETVARAEALGLDPRAALEANDSNRVFAALGDLIVTGPTGTNVMDLALGLVG